MTFPLVQAGRAGNILILGVFLVYLSKFEISITYTFLVITLVNVYVDLVVFTRIAGTS